MFTQNDTHEYIKFLLQFVHRNSCHFSFFVCRTFHCKLKSCKNEFGTKMWGSFITLFICSLLFFVHEPNLCSVLFSIKIFDSYTFHWELLNFVLNYRQWKWAPSTNESQTNKKSITTQSHNSETVGSEWKGTPKQ